MQFAIRRYRPTKTTLHVQSMNPARGASSRGARVAVIGAGPMGLGAAYELTRHGAEVHVLERDARIGGMSAHFEIDGTAIERYYHFICAPDATTFRYLDELGLRSRLRWTDTRM